MHLRIMLKHFLLFLTKPFILFFIMPDSYALFPNYSDQLNNKVIKYSLHSYEIKPLHGPYVSSL